MADALNTLAYGKVTGRFIALVADSGTTDPVDVDPANDFDDLPDVVTLSAKVTFTPSVDQVLLDGSDDGPARLVLPPIVAYLDNSGQLFVGGRPYVKLLATDTPHINPTDFSWRVSFSEARYGTGDDYVTIPSFDILVPTDSTIDLTRVAPIPAQPGTIIVRDEEAAKAAQAAAEAARTAAEAARDAARAAAATAADDAVAAAADDIADQVDAARAQAQTATTQAGLAAEAADRAEEAAARDKDLEARSRLSVIEQRFGSPVVALADDDFNNITETGTVYAEGLDNGPAELNEGAFVEVTRANGVTLQRAIGVFSGTTWERHKRGSSWEAWEDVTPYQRPAAGIPNSDLATPGYQKPANGIPASDLAESYAAFRAPGDHSALSTRHYILLASLGDPGASNTGSSSASFLVANIGDSRNGERASILVHAVFSSNGGPLVRAYGFGTGLVTGAPELYVVYKGTVLEVWGRFSAYQPPVGVTVLNGKAATFPLSESGSAPSSLQSVAYEEMTGKYVKPATGIPSSDLRVPPVGEIRKFLASNLNYTSSTSPTVFDPTPLGNPLYVDLPTGGWLIEWFVQATTGTGNIDMKFGLRKGKTTTSGQFAVEGPSESATTAAAGPEQYMVRSMGSTLQELTVGSLGSQLAIIRCTAIVTLTAADTLELVMAPATAGTITVYANSHLRATKIVNAP